MKLEMSSSRCSDSPVSTNCFFKIILPHNDSQTKLMIPRKFVKKYGRTLDSCISLKVPNGLVWQVNLERHKDEVWLQNGWQDFARFYSIQFGHLLVFKYRGHCDFKVRIFDPSSTEIDYPSSKSAKLHAESSRINKRAIETDHLTSSDLIRPCKKRVRKLALKDASHNGVCLMPKLQKQKTKLGDCPATIDEARARALASAEAFKSDNPFFFKVLKISHVDGKSRGLIVRKAFEESYKKWKDNDLVHLQVAGKIWSVICEMKWNKCMLRFGWDRFAQDNSLTVGDVCVFELINSCTRLLKVVIFHTAKETDGKENKRLPRVLRIEAKEAKVLASVNAVTSENPFFRVKVYPSSLYGGSLSLPANFIKKFITKDSCNVTLRISDGKEWQVKCTVYNSCAKFSVGWNIFARANHLAAGDVCIFELINISEKLMNVSFSETNRRISSELSR